MLQIKDLRKTYPGFSLQVSMEVQPGRIVGLIGANGAGKSTIFKSALGLIHTDGGILHLLGKDPEKLEPIDREQAGAVLSEAGFSEYLTIGDVKRVLRAMYSCFDQDFFTEKARAFGLEEKKKVGELSTGMKARLKVLSALSYHPKLLLLDEPTAGLDVVARDEVYGLVRTFMEEDETHAVLISSHISADLEKLCDEFYLIDGGRMLLHETADVLFSEYAVVKVTEEAFSALDKTYLLKYLKEPFGCSCLTNQRAFYQENNPELVIEKAGLDELITLMIRGEKI